MSVPDMSYNPRATDFIGEVGRSPELNSDSTINRSVRAKIRMTTASDNAEILTDLRDIVKKQLTRLKNHGLSGQFGPKEATVLHKMAQVYAILDCHTEKEHKKYEFSGFTTEQLETLAAQSKELPDDLG